MDAAAAAAGQRRHRHASARSLSPHRSELARVLEERIGLAAIARAGGMEQRARATSVRRSRSAASSRCAPTSPRPPARQQNSWPARTGRASARSPSTAGTPMSTKARSSGRLASAARRTRRRARSDRDQHGRGLERDRGRDRHRVRPHRARQRHRRHRPRHRHGGAPRRRRAQGRPGRSPIGRASRRPISTRSATSRPTTDLRAVLKGLLQGPPARGRAKCWPPRCSRTARR